MDKHALEKDLEAKANRYAEKFGWWQRKFKSPGRRSAPDRIYARNGRVFFVEYKRYGKSPTELQAREHKKMRQAGLTVYVCDRWSEALAIFEYENRLADAEAL